MRRKGFLWALGLVVVANAFALLGVIYNRSGMPDARLVLSERELPMNWSMIGIGPNSEDTGLRLRLDWQRSRSEGHIVLNRAKLEELGFDVAPEMDPGETKDLLDREAVGVFEFNGEAWAALVAEKQAELESSIATADEAEVKRLREMFDRFQQRSSRLVFVDAGLDASALRKRYADGERYLIAKIKVNAYYRYAWPDDAEDRNQVEGYASILLDDIYVPRDYHIAIAPPDKSPASSWEYDPDLSDYARYEVTLAYGRRHEPWVEKVTAR